MKKLIRTRCFTLWMILIVIIMGCSEEDADTFAGVNEGVAGNEGTSAATGLGGDTVNNGTARAGNVAGAGGATNTGNTTGNAGNDGNGGVAGNAVTAGTGDMIGFAGETEVGGEAGMDMVGLPDANGRVKSTIFGVSFYEREIAPVNGVGKGFLMMETEVTQALYVAVMGVNPSNFVSPYNPQLPVEQVSWEDGLRFANALSLAMGFEPAYAGNDSNAVLIEESNGFRYPLEAEWEWAARCGEDYEYAGSDNLDDVAWHRENSNGGTQPVGQKLANACGLMDMTGNVSEWAADDFDDPGQYVPGAAGHVRRGGGWDGNAASCGLSIRIRSSSTYSYSNIGLRLSRPFD